MLAGFAEAPSRACRSPKRRKTSEMVTMMEIRIRTIIIQVWSDINRVSMLVLLKGLGVGGRVRVWVRLPRTRSPIVRY